ncbi:MAG: YdcF family protein [Cyclobacteriaceae bacterium]|nr:YdcF family protein [Cyclobacteriaceae bacterium]
MSNEIILLWEVPPTPFADLKKKYMYGIVLTGVGKSKMEPTDRMYFSRGADRVTHTLQLYKLGFIQKILVSGGNGNLYTVQKQEADEMAEVLVLMGVPKKDIVVENTSRNTHESALEVPKMLRENVKPEECILVTSSFHIRRSKACFKKQGWNVDVFSTDFISHKRKFTPDALIIPSASALINWHILTREWAGIITYKLMGYI